jgi:hypothetical protein
MRGGRLGKTVFASVSVFAFASVSVFAFASGSSVFAGVKTGPGVRSEGRPGPSTVLFPSTQ